MAPPRAAGVKDFYRQKKNSGVGVSKKSSSTTNKKSSSAAFGSNVTQPPALISHGSPDLKDDYSEEEEVLRQFDMNMAYGPCVGMSRLGRWERANKLGLNPPKQIEGLLTQGKTTGLGCLWDARI
ncbi:hypothetical protein IFM89_038975 [Coptis chinensis]|uniref:DNA polymerase delta subunit 4 n=1 Tax=Coptis chinensis TaxID=261450 RepID=A0A835J1X0_9MAGN|nr:hypothetical protein IFM89_038975 [Coptis chinensis]